MSAKYKQEKKEEEEEEEEKDEEEEEEEGRPHLTMAARGLICKHCQEPAAVLDLRTRRHLGSGPLQLMMTSPNTELDAAFTKKNVCYSFVSKSI